MEKAEMKISLIERSKESMRKEFVSLCSKRTIINSIISSNSIMLQKIIIFDYTLSAYTNSIFSIDLSVLLSVLLCKIRAEK